MGVRDASKPNQSDAYFVYGETLIQFEIRYAVWARQSTELSREALIYSDFVAAI
jgi:hypothetical protein